MKKFILAATLAVLAATATGATAAPIAKAPFVPELAVETVSQRGQGFHQGNDRRYGERRHHILSPGEVARILHRKGFRKIHDVYFTRGVYVAKAFGHRGPVRLVVDARDGDVLSLDRIGRPGPGYGYGHGRSPSGNSFSFTLGIR